MDWSGGAPAAGLEPCGSRYWQRPGRGDRWTAGIPWQRATGLIWVMRPGERTPSAGAPSSLVSRGASLSLPRDSSGLCAPVRGPPSAGGSLPAPHLLGVPSRATWGSLRWAPGEGTGPTFTQSPLPAPFTPFSNEHAGHTYSRGESSHLSIQMLAAVMRMPMCFNCFNGFVSFSALLQGNIGRTITQHRKLHSSQRQRF